MLYVGGGCLDAAPELREFVARTGIPVAETLMGLGTYPQSQPLSLGMLGMHGTVYANYAVNEADLLLALGVRFDDRVTGEPPPPPGGCWRAMPWRAIPWYALVSEVLQRSVIASVMG